MFTIFSHFPPKCGACVTICLPIQPIVSFHLLWAYLHFSPTGCRNIVAPKLAILLCSVVWLVAWFACEEIRIALCNHLRHIGKRLHQSIMWMKRDWLGITGYKWMLGNWARLTFRVIQWQNCTIFRQNNLKVMSTWAKMSVHQIIFSFYLEALKVTYLWPTIIGPCEVYDTMKHVVSWLRTSNNKTQSCAFRPASWHDVSI